MDEVAQVPLAYTTDASGGAHGPVMSGREPEERFRSKMDFVILIVGLAT